MSRPYRPEYELGTAPGLELGGRARPQLIAALLRKMTPDLERRYPGVRSLSPVFDADGWPVDFRPSRTQPRVSEVRGPAVPRAPCPSSASLRRQHLDRLDRAGLR